MLADGRREPREGQGPHRIVVWEVWGPGIAGVWGGSGSAQNWGLGGLGSGDSWGLGRVRVRTELGSGMFGVLG